MKIVKLMNCKIYRQSPQIAAEDTAKQQIYLFNNKLGKLQVFTEYFQTEIHNVEEKFLVEISFRIVHGLFRVYGVIFDHLGDWTSSALIYL